MIDMKCHTEKEYEVMATLLVRGAECLDLASQLSRMGPLTRGPVADAVTKVAADAGYAADQALGHALILTAAGVFMPGEGKP